MQDKCRYGFVVPRFVEVISSLPTDLRQSCFKCQSIYCKVYGKNMGIIFRFIAIRVFFMSLLYQTKMFYMPAWLMRNITITCMVTREIFLRMNKNIITIMIISCPFIAHKYSISQEKCTRFFLCCALLWLYIDWFSHIHQAYFTGTVAI